MIVNTINKKLNSWSNNSSKAKQIIYNWVLILYNRLNLNSRTLKDQKINIIWLKLKFIKIYRKTRPSQYGFFKQTSND